MKKILISPLNWGLGHASRIIPVINSLQEMGYVVYIAGEGQSIDFLKEYYDEKMFIKIASPNIVYGKKYALGIGFTMSFIGFVRSMYKDYFALKKIIKDFKIDAVISDNRPGLFSKKIKSIYISHQINVKTRKPNSFSGRVVCNFHRNMILKYDYCIIPDNKKELSLAYELSLAPETNKFHYCGVLSRFNNFVENNSNSEIIANRVLVIISGPEPHRSIFEETVVNIFKKSNYNDVNIVRGVTGGVKHKYNKDSNIIYYDNPNDKDLYHLMQSSGLIICRSGYSTLMDLAVCKRKALLVPTPGQPEQEYLANHFRDNFGFDIHTQDELSDIDLSKYFKNRVWDYPYDSSRLNNVLNLCIEK